MSWRQTGMAQTIERLNSTAAKNGKATAPTATAVTSTETTERVVARRRLEAKKAKLTAVNEADRTESKDIGSPLVAPDGTLRMVPNLGRTVTVVGTVTNVDVNDGPHPKNIRGELGKAM